MGLSDEERQFKVFSVLQQFRYRLQLLQKVAYHKEIVQAWINDLDLLTGKEISRLESSSMYWLLGPKDTYQGLFGETYHVRKNTDKEVEYGSVSHFDENLSKRDFVELLRGKGFEISDTVNILAYYWDMWNWVASIFYPVLRYEDKLFLVGDFQSLIGKIANEKVLLFDSCYRDQLGEFRTEEVNLLCKFQLLQIKYKDLRDKKLGKKTGKAYFKALRKDSIEDEVGELIKVIGSMPMGMVVEKIEDFEQQEFEKSWKSKPFQAKDDPFKLKSPPYEVLKELAEGSFYVDQVETAIAILDHEYGTTCGLWNLWLEDLKFQTDIQLRIEKGEKL